MGHEPDLLIVGGGLSGGLAALALAMRRPDLDIRLIEREPTLGGNHVWSFFSADIDPEMQSVVDPLVVKRWERNSVHFPAHERTLETPYNSITSERFDEVIGEALGDRRLVGTATELGPTHATLADGTRLEARAVLDTRGLTEPPRGLACGWQKFVGQMLDIPGGHGIEHPLIMDATVDQSDGYRFVYLLPFDDNRLFVEDTYYQDDPRLDRDLLASRIADYARHNGWGDHRPNHEETGVLPVVIGGDFDTFWPADDPVARGGVRGGLFQPLTSYSLPEAARFADWLVGALPLEGHALAAATRAYAKRRWRSQRFYRLLGRMLFRAAPPPMRVNVFQRFYRLSGGLIERFYAGTSTAIDKVRILTGKPPVPIPAAIRALLGKTR